MATWYRTAAHWSEPDGCFLVEVPELPGCMADGKTHEEALANAQRVIAEWIETAQALGRPVPTPGVLAVLETSLRAIEGCQDDCDAQELSPLPSDVLAIVSGVDQAQLEVDIQ